jgi:hypothetical protein
MLRRAALWLLLPLACAGPAARRAPSSARLAEVRREAAGLLGDRTAMEWQRWAQGLGVDATSALRQRRWLLELPTLEEVRLSTAAAQTDEERRVLRYLYGFLIGEHVSKETAPLDARVKRLQLDGTVAIDGERVPFTQVTALLANEPDPARRRAIAAATRPVMVEVNRLLEERRVLEHELALRLGFADYVELSGAVRHFDPYATAELARRVLRGSEALYQSALAELAPSTLGLPAAEVRHADVPRLMKTAEYEAEFAADTLVPTVNRAFLDLGVDVTRLPVHLDARDLPKKNPRAACFPVSVPHDLRVSIKPVGGASDVVSLLHEMAHAVHLAYTRTDVFELQQLGDATVSEAFAFLIDGLMADPEWLAAHTAIEGPAVAQLARLGALKRLYMVRRYAAKVLYELELHRDVRTDARRSYTAHLARAYGFPVDDVGADRYLLDRDPFFYSAVYLRAWLLAAQLEVSLRSHFGPRWWASTAAGDILRGFWGEGQRLTGEEIAANLGATGLDAGPLLARLATALAGPEVALR